ncbi:HAD family hydrolase [Hymenobacter sp. B81]|uniref:HAD family hydrolase n=1 Tax=Hymenobacter sp. B81 TaxID=3344878 RepID=UPI0037DBFD05
MSIEQIGLEAKLVEQTPNFLIPSAIVFDLGGVLLDWNPRHLYRQLFNDKASMEQFLASVCTPAWNDAQDAGRPLAEATAQLVAEHPAHAAYIEAYYNRVDEMFGGPVQGTVAILEELRASGRYSLYALTNSSAETFPHALRLFPFLDWFDGIVISGEEKTRKPFPEIYQILLCRYGLEARRTVFIDDNPTNVKAAIAQGLLGIHFRSPEQLRTDLKTYGVLK